MDEVVDTCSLEVVHACGRTGNYKNSTTGKSLIGFGGEIGIFIIA